MDKTMENNIIIFTVLQELKQASVNHDASDVRIFAYELLNKVNYEINQWKNK